MAEVSSKRKASDMNGSNGDERDEPIIKSKKTNDHRRRSSFIKDRLPLPEPPKRSGNLLSCGQNEVGQLGFNDDVCEKTRPALVKSVADSKIVDVSAGGMHSLYLTEDGEVWSFGCNDEGALGRDTSEEGSEFEAQKVNLPNACIRITAGDSHSSFLLKDGRVFACGSFRDSHGTMGLNIIGKQQFPIEVVPGEEFVDIKSGADHLVMLSNRGKVFTVGCAEQGQLGRVSNRSSSGESRRGKTQLLQPALLTATRFNFVDAIWTTTYCTFLRNRSNGAVFGFGLNNYNQLGLAKKNSETVFTPQLTTFENVKSITGGQHHTLVITNDNKSYAIGRKDYGRLGLGEIEDEVDKLTLIKDLQDINVVQLDCGECCSFALTEDGKAYSWGMGSNQQLGIGSDEDQFKPVLLTGAQVREREVIRISSGGQHTLFIAAEKENKTNGIRETKTNGTNEAKKTNGTDESKASEKTNTNGSTD
ncbi:regulator of chromosome condensation-like [Contarinia nasturtii]|uniref:regulator of chromosome condensation-like n=1 Tax=Contarinia nasturtii TaxID=265458 RepID=UPI0012D46A47|nr:regulator of chromosome condensation-like [Contarinia nasturtii]XP_031638315.1 regulator of chromosome condensation-like [Contarinia nasturtii]